MIERIAILHSRLSGYFIACLRTLVAEYNVDLLVYHWPISETAPFDLKALDFISERYVKENTGGEEVLSKVERFDPQAVLMVGWMDQDYLRVARRLRKRKVSVVAGSDTQWKGSIRQQAARVIAPWYLHSAIDVLWVAGDRQRELARRLGYTGQKCWSGWYACEWERFSGVYQRHGVGLPEAFLYVGRYVERKGIDVLCRAYQHYRERVDDPWPLICAGKGPQQHLLEQTTGVENRGFIQPDHLPDLLREAGAFVLPSRKEPWGVVVQEAAAAGRPLICSSTAGAAVHLLQDGYNGFSFETGNAGHLSQCMKQITDMPEEHRKKMGCRSYELSKQFTPERWARTFVEGVQTLNQAKKQQRLSRSRRFRLELSFF